MKFRYRICVLQQLPATINNKHRRQRLAEPVPHRLLNHSEHQQQTSAVLADLPSWHQEPINIGSARKPTSATRLARNTGPFAEMDKSRHLKCLKWRVIVI